MKSGIAIPLAISFKKIKLLISKYKHTCIEEARLTYNVATKLMFLLSEFTGAYLKAYSQRKQNTYKFDGKHTKKKNMVKF